MGLTYLQVHEHGRMDPKLNLHAAAKHLCVGLPEAMTRSTSWKRGNYTLTHGQDQYLSDKILLQLPSRHT